MAHSSAVVIQRVTLLAGISTPIMPQFGTRVRIRNGCATDLLVYSTDGDDTTYAAISAGYDDRFDGSSWLFGEVVFWLKCSLGGSVTLIWT